MNEKKIQLKAIKLALLGDHTVGKSAICNVLRGVKFSNISTSTIGYDKFEQIYKVKNGSAMKVIIFDTAGQERFRSIVFPIIRNIQGIIIVFDVTNKDSFNNIDRWLKDVNERFDKPSMVLFANKTDYNKEEWAVTEEEVQKAAEKYKLKYFETSAKTKKNINEGFDYIINASFDALKENKDVFNLKDDEDDDKKEEKTGCFGKKKKKKKKNSDDKNSDKKKKSK